MHHLLLAPRLFQGLQQDLAGRRALDSHLVWQLLSGIYMRGGQVERDLDLPSRASFTISSRPSITPIVPFPSISPISTISSWGTEGSNVSLGHNKTSKVLPTQDDQVVRLLQVLQAVLVPPRDLAGLVDINLQHRNRKT